MSRAMIDVVVSTRDVVGDRMAGPGIRAFHFARELSGLFRTTLIARHDRQVGELPDVDIVDYGSAEADRRLRNCDVVISQPTREVIALHGPKRIYDLFDPVVLELRELYRRRQTLRSRAHEFIEWRRLESALRDGDLLVAATPQQRAFYAGVYIARGGSDSTWPERWLEIPFGIDEISPEPADRHENLVVWGGGVWEWLEPELAISAIGRLRGEGIDCKLLFLGGTHPNAAVRGVVREDLASAIRTAGDAVIWNEGWTPFRERGAILARSRVSLVTHRRTFEAEMAIRTRLFDAIWAAVPLVVSDGGYAAELVAREKIGIVVEPSNLDSVVEGVRTLLTHDGFHARCVSNLIALRERFTWKRTVEPLVQAITRWSNG